MRSAVGTLLLNRRDQARFSALLRRCGAANLWRFASRTFGSKKKGTALAR